MTGQLNEKQPIYLVQYELLVTQKKAYLSAYAP